MKNWIQPCSTLIRTLSDVWIGLKRLLIFEWFVNSFPKFHGRRHLAVGLVRINQSKNDQSVEKWLVNHPKKDGSMSQKTKQSAGKIDQSAKEKINQSAKERLINQSKIDQSPKEIVTRSVCPIYVEQLDRISLLTWLFQQEPTMPGKASVMEVSCTIDPSYSSPYR